MPVMGYMLIYGSLYAFPSSHKAQWMSDIIMLTSVHIFLVVFLPTTHSLTRLTHSLTLLFLIFCYFISCRSLTHSLTLSYPCAPLRTDSLDLTIEWRVNMFPLVGRLAVIVVLSICKRDSVWVYEYVYVCVCVCVCICVCICVCV